MVGSWVDLLANSMIRCVGRPFWAVVSGRPPASPSGDVCFSRFVKRGGSNIRALWGAQLQKFQFWKFWLGRISFEKPDDASQCFRRIIDFQHKRARPWRHRLFADDHAACPARQGVLQAADRLACQPRNPPENISGTNPPAVEGNISDQRAHAVQRRHRAEVNLTADQIGELGKAKGHGRGLG
jgi:hypothetical protein